VSRNLNSDVFSRFRYLSVLVPVSVLIACGSSSSPTSPSKVSDSRRIVVLGDSLAVTPTRNASFPAILQQRIARAGLDWTVVNAGVSGDTTTGGLRRFDEATADGVDVLVLALGANDGLRGVALSTVERNLASIIERAQARGSRVLLCGMETPPAHGWTYTLGFHEIFPRLAGQYGVPLAPFLLTGVALVPEMNGSDGIHPNAAGAARIADNVWQYLEPILADSRLAA
jgi:acyl-CoA thioesterase I